MSSVIAPIHLRSYLKEVIYELESNKFSAHRCPDNRPSAIEGRDIWVAENHNPEWYSGLIRRYPRIARKNGFPAIKGGAVRKADSNIHRNCVFRVLTRLSKGKKSWSKIAPDLIDIAQEKHESGQEITSEVQQFFWETYQILLPNEIDKFLQNKPQEIWEIFLYHYIEHNKFPPDFMENNEVPF